MSKVTRFFERVVETSEQRQERLMSTPNTDPREAAIDAASKWVRYQQSQSPDGVVDLDRPFIEGLFDAAHDEGHLVWAGEQSAPTPVVAGTHELDPDLVEAVQKLQTLRDEHRTRSYSVMNRIAQLAGLGASR